MGEIFNRILLVLILMTTLPACSGGSPMTSTASPPPALEQARATPTARATPPETANPTDTAAVTSSVETPPTETLEETATLSEWDAIQVSVARFRNKLEAGSDGYNGLALALEQDSPNADWCGGLSAAIGDFNYAGDSESAGTLEDLQESQGCP